MAEKRCYTPQGAAESAELTADHAAAEKFDRVRVGALGVYFREGLKTRFVPYSYMERAFIRIQEVNARVCCGSTCFAYYRLVLVHDGKEYADIPSESEKAMDGALARMQELSPDLAVGYPAQA